MTPEEQYQEIIELGRRLPPMNPAHKTPDNLVPGCQSRLYLHAESRDGKIFFEADSDALISKGLAALLLERYNGQSSEFILKNPPTILDTLPLSPTRITGAKSLYTRMQKQALLLYY